MIKRIFAAWLIIVVLSVSIGYAADPGDTVRFKGTIGSPEINEPIIKMGGVLVSTVGATSGDYAAAQLATTGNITLSGEQVVDGVLTAASAVVVWQQTNGTQNGLYTSNSSAWVRRTDADTGAKFSGNKAIYVQAGLSHAGKVFRVANTTTVTLGTTAIIIAPESSYWYTKPLQVVDFTDTINCNPPVGPFIGAILPIVGVSELISLGDPQLLPGLRENQFCLMRGMDETNTVEVRDGAGVSLTDQGGEVILTDRTTLLLQWHDGIWQQVDQFGSSSGTGGGSASGLQENCDIDCVLRSLTEELPFVFAPAGQPGPEERIFSPDGNFYRARRQGDGSPAGPERLVIPLNTCWEIASVFGTPASEQTVGQICNDGIGVSLNGIFLPNHAMDMEFSPTTTTIADNVQAAIDEVNREPSTTFNLRVGNNQLCDGGTDHFWQWEQPLENERQWPSPPGCWTRLRMKLPTGTMPSGQTATFVLRVNGVSSALSCAIGPSGTTCSSDEQVCVLNGDLVNMQETCSGGSTSIANIAGSIDLIR